MDHDENLVPEGCGCSRRITERPIRNSRLASASGAPPGTEPAHVSRSAPSSYLEGCVDGAQSTACSPFDFLSSVKPVNAPVRLAASTISSRPSDGILTIPPASVHTNASVRCPLTPLIPMIAPAS